MASPMNLFIRGANPIWFEVDLTAHAFDDTFYLFVLQNELPYIPATVYHDQNGNVPWTNPIRFLANGTLPIDIFWDPTQVYRLEFRQGNTQYAPLIYLVENYVPGSGGGDVPVDVVANSTTNQFTNPQFSLISFSSPYTLTNVTNPAPIEVAPGWFLNLAGTGSVTLTQVPLSSAEINPTNASYALQIQLSGTWTGTPYLSQRFNQNGMLWTSDQINLLYAAVSVTAMTVGGTQNITAALVDSQSNILASFYGTGEQVDSTWNEYTDNQKVSVTTNTNIPPVAWVEYQLYLPTTINIYLSSFQLISTDVPLEFTYEQDSIERQVDHTWHYYKNSVLISPKDSILTGWDFGLNPWQFTTTTLTNLPTFGYIADQTIVMQQAYVASATGNNISVGQATYTFNYGFQVQAVTATNQFAILQYIDPDTVAPYWGSILSSLVKLTVRKQSPSGNLRIKMRIIYNASLPSALSQTYPIASWAANGEPVYAGGWTAIAPENDPVYNLINGNNVIKFEGINLSTIPSTSATMTMGIIFYTIDSMIQTGTPDYIIFNKASLVPNQFAIDCNSLSYDETLRRCQYYYETSFAPGQVATATNKNIIVAQMYVFYIPAFNLANSEAIPFSYQYKVVKRNNPTLSFYSGQSSTPNKCTGYLYTNPTGTLTPEVTFSSYFTAISGANGQYGFAYSAIGGQFASGSTTGAASAAAAMYYHFIANSQM